MIEALENQIIERLAVDPWLDHAVDAPGDHDLAGLGFVAEARGEVGDAADRGVFQPLLEADLAQGRIAERDADAEAEAVPAVAPALRQGADGVAHLHPHLHPALDVSPDPPPPAD